jgi:hypothetical protein
MRGSKMRGSKLAQVAAARVGYISSKKEKQ